MILNDSLTQWMLNNPKEAISMNQDMKKDLEKNRCSFEGQILPLSLVPLFMTKSQHRLLKKTSEAMASVINKTIDASFKDKTLRDYFVCEEVPDEWIDVDPGYRYNIGVTRLDTIFDGKVLKYIEFNTDNPGGKAWTDTLQKIMASYPMYRDIIPKPERYSKMRIAECALEATKKIFREFSGKRRTPSVAFIDYRESKVMGDCELLTELFIEKGISAFIADPRDFRLENGVTMVGDRRVDLVHRGMKAQEFLQYPQEVKPFLEGYFSRAFCMINSFRSVLGSEKSILALITNPKFHNLYTDEEVEIIKEHIPWTRRLSETTTFSPSGEEISLKDHLIQNRTKLVLKPSWGYGGKGVVLGYETPEEEWKKLVEEHIGQSGWVVQDYVKIPQFEIPTIVNDQIVLQKKYYNVNPYVFNGKYAGVLGRFSDKAVINVSHGGGMLNIYDNA